MVTRHVLRQLRILEYAADASCCCLHRPPVMLLAFEGLVSACLQWALPGKSCQLYALTPAVRLAWCSHATQLAAANPHLVAKPSPTGCCSCSSSCWFEAARQLYDP